MLGSKVGVHVYSHLAAAFSTGFPIAEVGVPIDLVGEPSLGSGVYTAFEWQFPSHAPVSTQNVTWTFPAAGGIGSIPVTFSVNDSLGVTASTTVNVHVNASMTLSAIGASVGSPHPNDLVRFVASAGLGVPGYGYHWTFGDGTSSTVASPQHAYNGTGTYQVNVTVTDADGKVLTRSLNVTVSNAPVSLLTLLTTPPYLYVLIAGIVVVVVVVLVAVRRRRTRFRGTTRAEPPASSGTSGRGGASSGEPPRPPERMS